MQKLLEVQNVKQIERVHTNSFAFSYRRHNRIRILKHRNEFEK